MEEGIVDVVGIYRQRHEKEDTLCPPVNEMEQKTRIKPVSS